MSQLKFLEPTEVESLLAMPKLRSVTGLRNRLVMQIMWETGARISEVLDLRPRDVTIGEKKVVIQRGKGGKTRVVYWRSEELSLLLEKWYKRRVKSDYLFPTVRSQEKGKRIDNRSFRNQFDRYVVEAGVPDWTTCHTLRHSFATNFLARGGNIRTLQLILGHASLATTECYLHIADKDIAKAMRGY